MRMRIHRFQAYRAVQWKMPVLNVLSHLTYKSSAKWAPLTLLNRHLQSSDPFLSTNSPVSLCSCADDLQDAASWYFHRELWRTSNPCRDTSQVPWQSGPRRRIEHLPRFEFLETYEPPTNPA